MSIKHLFHNSQPCIQLSPDILDAVQAIAARQQCSLDDAVNELISQALHEREAAQHNLHIWRQLTHRERQVTALIWAGLLNPQIADRLGISTHTVRSHVKNILTKFRVPSKKHLFNILNVLDLSEWVDIDHPTN